MKILNSDEYLNGKKTVTLGKFDGLHRGHSEIFEAAAVLKKQGYEFVAASFSTHPNVVTQNEFDGVLLSKEEKKEHIQKMGADYYCEIPFDTKMMNTEAEDFFNDFIVNRWSASNLIVGDDFNIGKNRRGDIDLISSLCKDNDIRLYVIDRMLYDGEPISSSKIKTCLKKGEIQKANDMLGYEYFFKGNIVHGNAIGNKIGFPTINIIPEDDRFLPRYGVYKTKVILEGKKFKGITNIGVKPTIDGERKPLIETNILDFDSEVYGKLAEVRLISFVRGEEKFSSIDELKKQIESDKNSWTNS